MTCHEHAIDQLREAGIRLTPQRALVLDVVYHSDGHLTADQVYEQVRAQSPYVDLSTVYRNLVFLRQQGLIGELRLEGQPARFEAVRSGHRASSRGLHQLRPHDRNRARRFGGAGGDAASTNTASGWHWCI